MKKNRGDEPIGVIIHIYMEISKETLYVAIFISNKQRHHFFLFFYKIAEHEDETNPAQGGYQGEVAGKGVGG
jgi:hypothetical protein